MINDFIFLFKTYFSVLKIILHYYSFEIQTVSLFPLIIILSILIIQIIRNIKLMKKIKLNITDDIKKIIKTLKTQKFKDCARTFYNGTKSRTPFIYFWINIIFIIAVITVITSFINYLFFFQPFIAKEYTYPQDESALENQQRNIRIRFTLPIKREKLKEFISPELKGDWEFIPCSKTNFFFKNLYKEISFHPSENLKGGDRIVIYLVGISPIGTDQNNEYSTAFTIPNSMEIVGSNLIDNKEHIPINSILHFYLNGNSNLNDYNIKLQPETEFSVVKSGNMLNIIPNQNLQQGVDYQISIEILPKQNSNNDLIVQEPVIYNYDFRTVNPGEIKDYLPKGTGAKTSEKIRIVFNEPVNKGDIEEHFSITPKMEGAFNWIDDSTVEYVPTTEFTMETKYNITISSGFRTQNGGYSEEDITWSFTTIGEIKLLDAIPKNGARGVDIDTKTFSLTFNQEVDKDSLEKNLSIQPSLPGTIYWKDNTIIYNLSSKLAYATSYTIRIKAGVKSLYGKDLQQDIVISFNTESKTEDNVILDVPWYKQTESFTCNVQATNMALSYRGINLGEQGIKQALGIGPALNEAAGTGGNPYNEWVNYYGVYWTAVSRLISQYRANEIKTNWTIQGLVEEIQKGNPSIIWWHNGWSKFYWKTWTTPDGQTITGLNGMHSEVVVGFAGPPENPTYIITNDPWRGKNRYYPIDTFTQRWAIFNNTAIVVY